MNFCVIALCVMLGPWGGAGMVVFCALLQGVHCRQLSVREFCYIEVFPCCPCEDWVRTACSSVVAGAFPGTDHSQCFFCLFFCGGGMMVVQVGRLAFLAGFSNREQVTSSAVLHCFFKSLPALLDLEMFPAPQEPEAYKLYVYIG